MIIINFDMYSMCWLLRSVLVSSYFFLLILKGRFYHTFEAIVTISMFQRIRQILGSLRFSDQIFYYWESFVVAQVLLAFLLYSDGSCVLLSPGVYNVYADQHADHSHSPSHLVDYFFSPRQTRRQRSGVASFGRNMVKESRETETKISRADSK